MNIILFRGLKAYNKQWLYGDAIHWASGRVGVINHQTPRSNSPCYEVIKESLTQYIRIDETVGEKRKIFEEDIVEASWYDNNECVTQEIGVIKYDTKYCGYGIFDSKMNLLAGINSYNDEYHLELEILGNTFDNPTLLGELSNE